MKYFWMVVPFVLMFQLHSFVVPQQYQYDSFNLSLVVLLKRAPDGSYYSCLKERLLIRPT